jgi:group I intron endonuclease
MYIYRALLKHGYSNFSLTILEYCSPEKCLEREDYYFQLLKHEYNICFATKSRLQTWLKHSEKTLENMSNAQNAGHFKTACGENHPMFVVRGKIILTSVNQDPKELVNYLK